jgi:hypothetical protein
MGLILSTEQVAGLPNGGGVITSPRGPTLTREGSGAKMRGSITLRKTIATHPRMIALEATTVAGCLALLITFVVGLWERAQPAQLLQHTL